MSRQAVHSLDAAGLLLFLEISGRSVSATDTVGGVIVSAAATVQEVMHRRLIRSMLPCSLPRQSPPARFLDGLGKLTHARAVLMILGKL